VFPGSIAMSRFLIFIDFSNQVNERIDDLMQLKEEMEAMLVDFEKRLRELEGSKG
jgi:predicted component of type VI protein secretion system